MKKLPVGIQLYSVRNEAEADFEGTLAKIKEFGYDGVEFAGLYGKTPAEVKELCEKYGLCPISAHVPLTDMMRDPVGVLSQYKEIGCKYVAVPHIAPEIRPGTPNFEYTMQFIAVIGKCAKKLGLQLLYHNHDFEFVKVDGKYGLDLLYETVPADLLQTELDLCWVNVGGEEPAAYLRKYTGRAPVVHFKDFYGEKSDDMYELIGVENKAPKRPSGFEFRPIGSGLQDVPALVSATHDAAAEWIIVEQDKPSMGLDPLECAKKSIEYLRSIGQ